MMELLQTRLEQESMHRDIASALVLLRELPSIINKGDNGSSFTWGPDGGDVFEQARRTASLTSRSQAKFFFKHV